MFNMLTCHYILRGCVTICSHHAGRYMSLVPFWTIFGKSKIRKLGIVVLDRSSNTLEMDTTMDK